MHMMRGERVLCEKTEKTQKSQEREKATTNEPPNSFEYSVRTKSLLKSDHLKGDRIYEREKMLEIALATQQIVPQISPVELRRAKVLNDCQAKSGRDIISLRISHENCVRDKGEICKYHNFDEIMMIIQNGKYHTPIGGWLNLNTVEIGEAVHCNFMSEVEVCIAAQFLTCVINDRVERSGEPATCQRLEVKFNNWAQLLAFCPRIFSKILHYHASFYTRR